MTNPAPKCEICGDPSFDGRRCRGCRAAMANPSLPVDARPAPSDTPPPLNTGRVTAGDIAWLKGAKDQGHCGEGTSERKGRDEHNARIDRLLYSAEQRNATITERDALKAEMRNAVEDHGFASLDDLVENGRVGRSFMEELDRLIKGTPAFNAWAPLNDPAEILHDLQNHYEDELSTLRFERDRAVEAAMRLNSAADSYWNTRHKRSERIGRENDICAAQQHLRNAIQPKGNGDA